jgi:hypothetical protein
MWHIVPASYEDPEPFNPEDAGNMFLRNVSSYKEPHGVFIS